MKKAFWLIVIPFLAYITVPMMAQTKAQKDTNNAKVVITNGQERLVLKDQIELNMNAETWRSLDSLTTAPFGGNGIQLKDIQSYKVLVQKGRINNEVGLMFTCGTKVVAITEDEFGELRNSSSRK